MTRSPLARFRPSANGLLVAMTFALSAATMGTLVTPAYANSTDYRCAGLADQARSAAQGAEGSTQRNAARLVTTGDKLCEAGNRRAAAKQYRAALKLAGVAETPADDSRLAVR